MLKNVRKMFLIVKLLGYLLEFVVLQYYFVVFDDNDSLSETLQNKLKLLEGLFADVSLVDVLHDLLVL